MPDFKGRLERSVGATKREEEKKKDEKKKNDNLNRYKCGAGYSKSAKTVDIGDSNLAEESDAFKDLKRTII